MQHCLFPFCYQSRRPFAATLKPLLVMIGSMSDSSGYVILFYLSLWLVGTSEVSHVDDAHKCWAARTAEIGSHTTSEVVCSISFLFQLDVVMMDEVHYCIVILESHKTEQTRKALLDDWS